MALIVRSELEQQCRIVGRNVETEVVTRISQNKEKMTNDEIDQVFKPLVDFVEKKTEEKVRQEIDEAEALAADKQQEIEKQNRIDRLFAGISERTDLEYSYFDPRTKVRNFVKCRNQKIYDNHIKFAKFYKRKEAQKELDKKTLHQWENYSDSKFDRFVPIQKITFKQPYDYIFHLKDEDKIMTFIDEEIENGNISSIEKLLQLVQNIKNHGMCRYSWDFDGYLRALHTSTKLQKISKKSKASTTSTKSYDLRPKKKRRYAMYD